MKIVLSKREIKGLAKFIDEMDKVNGINPTALEEVKRNITVDKKSFMSSLIDGQLTFEVKENCTTEFISLVNDFLIEGSPILKACYNLGIALTPTVNSYQTKFKRFFDKYKEPTTYDEKAEPFSNVNGDEINA